MKIIGIRVDGSENIGLGHIMRMISLASYLKDKGNKIIFISKYEIGIRKIMESGFDFIKIKSEKSSINPGFFYGSKDVLEDEVKDLSFVIQEKQIQTLIVDSYNITEEYFLKLKNCVERLVYIDDCNFFNYPVDVIVNGNLDAQNTIYNRYFDNTALLLGIEYNLLRSEFRNIRTIRNLKNVSKILITVGGSDPFNITEKIINTCISNLNLKNYEYHVIVGGGFVNISELKKLSDIYSNIKLYFDTKEMKKLMLSSDIAISAGGSTLYELSACGTPTLTFAVAENQKNIVTAFENRKAVLTGFFDEEFDENKFVQVLSLLVYNYSLRRTISNNGRAIVKEMDVEKLLEELIK